MRPLPLSLLIGSTLFFSSTSFAAMTIKYQHTDVLGSVIAETNANGQVIKQTKYHDFGEQKGGQQAGLGYTGHLEDTDLGLTYMQQRYYDPVIGRFYSNDPVGFNTDNLMMFNRYAYANNNPYKYVDPDGRTSWPTEKNSTGKVVVTSSYGPRDTGIKGASSTHNGTDFRAPLEAKILAPQDGKVASIEKGDEKGGNSIYIANDDGSMNGFAHTTAAEGLKEGDTVAEGSIIGTSDGTGTSSTPHLHLTYREGTTDKPADKNTKTVNPMTTQFKDMSKDEVCTKSDTNKC